MKSKGIKAKNIKNGNPLSGQEMLNNIPDNIESRYNWYFFII